MKKLISAILVAAIGISLSACGSMPKHNETTIDKASSIVFRGGPPGSVITIDGAQVGSVGRKTRETIINVKDGSHQVTVTSVTGATIYERIVIVDDGMRKIVELGKR